MTPGGPLRPVVAPPPVRPGDRVGVAAISGAIDPEALASGLEELVRLGFEPVTAANLGARSAMLAGTDEERLRGFHDLADDPSVAAVLFARGGYGSLRVLPAIDWGRLAERPRAYVGYSDLTPFLHEVNRELGLAALHGPMVAGDLARGLEAVEIESLLGALAGEPPPPFDLAGAAGPGPVTAPVVGGCLSMIGATLGTPFAPSLEGAILFWEDVNEPLYRLDRLLTHLRLSGSLARIRGMVVGEMIVSDAEDFAEGAFEEMLLSLSAEFGWPVGWGLQSGHGQPNLTVPLGFRATLDVARRRLTFESEVSA